MHIEVEHVFEAPVEVIEAAMLHPDYPAFLLSHHASLEGLSPQSFEDDGVRVSRRVHYAPKPAFEHIGPKKVPPQWFEFVEDSVWDRQRRTMAFEHIPTTDKVQRRLSTRGEIALEALSPTRTRRRARAEIKVANLPFMLRALGPLAEQMLGREARRMLELEAQVLDRFVREQLNPAAPRSAPQAPEQSVDA